MQSGVPKSVSRYMARIGAIGGSHGTHTLTHEQAMKLVAARRAKRAKRGTTVGA